jgi:hypothetical protein
LDVCVSWGYYETRTRVYIPSIKWILRFFFIWQAIVKKPCISMWGFFIKRFGYLVKVMYLYHSLL